MCNLLFAICCVQSTVCILLRAESAVCDHAAFSRHTTTIEHTTYGTSTAVQTARNENINLLEYHVTPSVRELVQQALPYPFSCCHESLLAAPLELSKRLPLTKEERETNEAVTATITHTTAAPAPPAAVGDLIHTRKRANKHAHCIQQ